MEPSGVSGSTKENNEEIECEEFLAVRYMKSFAIQAICGAVESFWLQ